MRDSADPPAPDPVSFVQALPYIRKILAAFKLPDLARREGAYWDAFHEIAATDCEAKVVVTLSAIAGLAGTPGQEVYEAELADPEPRRWVPHARRAVDAGTTGDLVQIAQALHGAYAQLDRTESAEMIWYLAQAASEVMDQAGGFAAYELVMQWHWDAYEPQRALPLKAASMEPAGIVVAAVAAGHQDWACGVLARHCASRAARQVALIHIWVALAARILGPEPGVLRLTPERIPDTFVSRPADRDEEIAVIARDMIAARTTGDDSLMGTALGRLDAAEPGELLHLAWTLACTIGMNASMRKHLEGAG